MTREQAWTHYFTSGDREPLVRAYWDSINYLSWALYPYQQEDAFQVGMMGLLKAIERIDSNRVKSKDAWVWLNVKGMMWNQAKIKPSLSIDDQLTYFAGEDQDVDFDLMLRPLKVRQRLILSLIYRHDWHRTEIAELLSISSMRVGQIEKSALEQIRKQMRFNEHEVTEILR